jgi:hypothetical protein
MAHWIGGPADRQILGQIVIAELCRTEMSAHPAARCIFVFYSSLIYITEDCREAAAYTVRTAYMPSSRPQCLRLFCSRHLHPDHKTETALQARTSKVSLPTKAAWASQCPTTKFCMSRHTFGLSDARRQLMRTEMSHLSLHHFLSVSECMIQRVCVCPFPHGRGCVVDPVSTNGFNALKSGEPHVVCLTTRR